MTEFTKSDAATEVLSGLDFSFSDRLDLLATRKVKPVYG